MSARLVCFSVIGVTASWSTESASHKPEGNGYAKNRYLSTFVGYAPASSPRFVIAVMLDEPSAGKYFGGAVAAPVFNRVMTGALRMHNVPHDAPSGSVMSFTAAPPSSHDIGDV